MMRIAKLMTVTGVALLASLAGAQTIPSQVVKGPDERMKAG